ncbi:hypothetical protein CFC21_068894 [Triticum aestivum]|uniref:Ubiquitin-like protease family profile domain-containing protein n=2 Tax=Triticum aestivum TaxID=4565 RepID=A0A3B6KQZ5_WHEAT|nr:uncharacterized protein LOC119304059 [Triticum dicoccoides]XP_044383985.1 uncharacterized protein LOC123105883 [Triticum aestivum]KAF7062270.1 hypothetical protein CFC21_068894 [Triticum aestivum]
MPLVPADYKNVIRPLFDKVRPCVVSIEAYAKAVIKEETLPLADEHKDVTNVKKEENKWKAAGTGFVVHCSNNFTVVTVHTSFKFQGQNAVVKFSDGTEATDTRVIKLKGPMNLIVANIPHGDWKAVRYDQIREDGYSQIVLSIFSLMYWRLPCVCRIISPRCTAVLANGRKVPGSEQTFSFNLPVAGKQRKDEYENHDKQFCYLRDYVLGAPVFDTYGKLVGFVNQCGKAFDFKFGVRSEYLQDALYKWLAGKQWKDVLNPRSQIWHPDDKEHVDSSVGLRGGVGGLPHVPLDQEDNFQFDSSVGLRGGVGGRGFAVCASVEEDNFQFDSLIASGDKEKESEGEKVVVVDKVSSDIVDLRTNNFVADGVITKYLKHLSSTKLNNDDEVYLADATVSSAYAQDASAINVELLRRSRLVLLPVNNNTNFGRADMGTHWSLFLIDAINGPPPQFYHMDSLDGLNRSAADRLATALGAVFPDAPGVVQVSTPRQKKSYDCAIYVMALAKSIITWWKSRTESTKHWMQMIQTDVTEENVHTLRHDFADRLEQDEKNQKVECNKEEKAKE